MKFKPFFKTRRCSDNNVSEHSREDQNAIPETTPEVENQEEVAEADVVTEPDVDVKAGESTTKLYNLIILDESGSMSCVTSNTISGCNEVLHSIRSVAAEDDSMTQIVSIYCFDSEHSRYIIENKEIGDVEDVTEKDYCPRNCTPLYDAIGYTVTQLEKIANGVDAVAKVTIITDGLENASREWTYPKVVALINKLKEKGWLFTFMGANIDVERTSKGLGIDSFLEFNQTDEGMTDMFSVEIRAQKRFAQKVKYMRSRDFFRGAGEEDQRSFTGACGENYFDETDRISPDNIQELQPDEIFVFSSNIRGAHDCGAAAMALAKFGAISGQAEGPQGQSYAIPTDGASLEQINGAIERFTDYVIQNRDKKFMLTEIGCGEAGYEPRQIAPLFLIAYQFDNLYVPASFLPYL